VRAVLDTNVVISAIFFGGLPRQILARWIDGGFELCLSPAIFDEYLKVCDRLAVSHPGLEYRELLAAILGHATLVTDNDIAMGSPQIPTTTSSWPVGRQPRQSSYRVTDTSSTRLVGAASKSSRPGNF